MTAIYINRSIITARMDNLRYEIYQEEQFQRFEGICKRCGECCGSQDGDPCVNLARDTITGRYYCRDYENRLAPQKTASDRIFNCVAIRNIIKLGLLRPNCAYNRVTGVTGSVYQVE